VAQVLEAKDDIAAVILEPIQSMAGITTAPDAYFKALRSLCNHHDVLLIFDEVQTGVGRTGTFSISESLGITPDLITLAKSLGSGVPVGAVLASDAIAAGVQPGDQGTTFGGGMLAMAAVTATLETILEMGLMDRAPVIYEQIRTAVAPLVRTVHGQGCLIGLELETPARPILGRLREAGVLTGSSGNPHVLRLMPPLTTSDEDIAFFAEALDAVLAAETA
jgi:acetylornithine/succinyldiaminopimelate/putrescine aminotransferase